MPAKAKNATPASYEVALQELENLLQQIEAGSLPLEQLLAGYQRGAELLAFCRQRLDQVQSAIEVLDEQAAKPAER